MWAAISWFTGLLIATVVSIPVIALVAGGCLAGSLLAHFIPQRWFGGLMRPPGNGSRIPLGSTATLANSSLPLAILVFAFLAAAAWAQESRNNPVDRPPSSGTAATPAPVAGSFSILVPVDREGKPAPDKESVVYAPAELLAELRRLAGSRAQLQADYLISSADYRGVIDARQSVVMEARYQIAVISSGRPVRIRLPITNANLDAPNGCLIDGKPHAVLSDPNHAGFFIDWEGRPPFLAATTDAAHHLSHADSDSAHTVEKFDVVLRLYPLPVSSPGGGAFRIKIPPVATGHVSLRFSDGAPPSQVVLGRDRFSPPFQRSADLFVADLNRGDQLEAYWSSKPILAQTEMDADIIRFVSVHPTRLEYRYRVACRVARGSVDRLTCLIPRGAVVRSVAEGLTHEIHLPAGSSAPAQLTVFFPEPRQDKFTTDFSLMLPIAHPEAEILVPLIDPFNGLPDAGIAKVTLNEVGLLAAPEFRLTGISHEADRLTTLTADSPLKRETLAVGLRDAELAYRIPASMNLHVRLSPLSPLRKIKQTQQGTIGRTKLDWKLTAEIQTENVPAFSHRLLVDPRLKIDSISVQEDGAERLVRSARDGEHVNLFLRDRTTATQDVVLVGSMPLAMSAETSLPIVRFDDAQVMESRLTLTHDPEVPVQILGADTPAPTNVAEKEKSEAKTMLLKDFPLPENTPLPRLRLLPRNEQVTVDSATFVNSGGDRPGMFSIWLHLRYSEHPWPKLHLKIPREISANYQLSAPQARIQHENRDDGSVDVTLDLTTVASPELMVVVNSSLPTALKTNWLLPQINVRDTTGGVHYLLLSADQSWRPTDGAAEDIATRLLPEWIATASPLALDRAGWRAYLRRGADQQNAWGISGTSERTDTFRLRIPLVRISIESDHNGQMWGVTEAVVLDAPGRQSEWILPEGTSPRAIFINGRQRVIASQTDRITIPLDAGTGPQTVVFYWLREAASGKWLYRMPHAAPHPIEITERSTQKIITPRQSWIVYSTGADSQTLREQTALIAEGLLAAARSGNSAQLDAAGIWPLLARLRDIAGHDIAVEPTNSSPDLSESESILRHRLSQIVEDIDSLKSTAQRAIGSVEWDASAAGLSAGSLSGLDEPVNRNVLLGINVLTSEQDLGASESWAIHWGLLRVLAALVGFVTLAFVGSKLARLRDVALPFRSRGSAEVLLGLIWWLCLWPSAAGLVLLIGAGISALRRKSLQPQIADRHDSFELAV